MSTEDDSNVASFDPEMMRSLHADWFGEASAPLLFRAVNLKAWEICRPLLWEREKEVSAQELNYVDSYGYSALHYACWWSSSAPLEVVQRIIKNSKTHFISLPNREGRTPLHLAAWKGTDEVVELLAQKCPTAAGVMDRTQKTPLLDACQQNRSKRVLQALVKADPTQIGYRNNHRRSAASLFFRRSHGYVSAPHETQFSEEEEQVAFKVKARVILAAERTNEDMDVLDLDQDVYLTQAAIQSLSCPYLYAEHLLDQLTSETIRTMRDEMGNTFLHVAVTARKFHFENFFKCDRCQRVPSKLNVKQKMYFHRNPGRAGVRCSTPSCCGGNRLNLIHYVLVPVVSKERAIVEYLLRRCPSLASLNNRAGRTPLELALESGRTWASGVKELVMANPEALTHPSSSNGLYPFQMVATVRRTSNRVLSPRKKNHGWTEQTLYYDEDELKMLGTVYHLLRECPDLILSSQS